MEIFSKETLLLNVLNGLTEKLNFKSSDLVFLNYDFSNEKIADLMNVLSEKQIKRINISRTEFEKIVSSIKLDLKAVHSICQLLIDCFISEERSLAVFDDKARDS